MLFSMFQIDEEYSWYRLAQLFRHNIKVATFPAQCNGSMQQHPPPLITHMSLHLVIL
jgi:hypothetical protein